MGLYGSESMVQKNFIGLYNSENKIQKIFIGLCSNESMVQKNFIGQYSSENKVSKKMIIDIYVFYFYKLFIEIVFIESGSEKEFVQIVQIGERLRKRVYVVGLK